MADRTVFVRLEAIIGPYQRKMAEAAAATRKLSQEERDLQKATVDMGRNLQRAGTMLTIGVTAPLLLMAKHAADVAMTAQETKNKVTVAFGDMEQAVHEWSDGSAKSMGLARHEAEGASATFQTMFTAMGLGTRTAFDMSTGVVQLAADLGSFFDVDPSEMLERVRSGLVGEIEPLRRVGILLSDQAVRQKAVELGLATSTDEVSEAVKVQARYALILDQSSKAQGDYARTADSATNSTRTARAAYEDAMVELGENMLPLIAKGAQTITALADAFSSLPGPAQSTILAVGGVVAAIGPLLILTGSVIRNLQTIQSVGPKAAAALKFGGAASGIAALAFGMKALADAIDQAIAGTPEIDDVTSALVDLAQGDAGFKAVGDAARYTQNSIGDLLRQVERTGEGKSGIEKKLEDIDQGLANIVEGGNPQLAAKALEEVANALGVSVSDIKPYLGEYTDAVRNAKTAADISAGSQEGLASGIDGVGDAAETAEDRLAEFNDMLDKLYGRTFGVEEATDRFTSDLGELVDAVNAAKEAGDGHATSLDDLTQTGLANQEMMRGLVRDALDVAAAMKENEEPPERIAAAMSVLRQSLLDTAADLGIPEAKARAIVDVLLQLDGMKVTTTVFADTAQAEAALNDVLNQLNEVSALSEFIGPIVADLLGREPAIAPFRPPTAPTPGPKSGSADAGAGYLESLFQQRMETIENRFKAGEATLDEYMRSLDEQMAREVPWTSAWVALQQKKADAVHYWTDASTAYLKALYDAQVKVENAMYEVGDLGKDRYLEILNERLRGLQRYSEEWLAVWRQIQQLEGDILDTELRIIEAVEAQRLFDKAFYEAAPQRSLWDQYMTPASSSVSTSTTYYGSSWSPTFINQGGGPDAWMTTSSQKLRDYAAVLG